MLFIADFIYRLKIQQIKEIIIIFVINLIQGLNKTN